MNDDINYTVADARYDIDGQWQDRLQNLIGDRDVRDLPWHAIWLGSPISTERNPLVAVKFLREIRGDRINANEIGLNERLTETVYIPLIERLNAQWLEDAPEAPHELLFVKALCNVKKKKIYNYPYPTTTALYQQGDIYYEAIEDFSERDQLVRKYLNGKRYIRRD